MRDFRFVQGRAGLLATLCALSGALAGCSSSAPTAYQLMQQQQQLQAQAQQAEETEQRKSAPTQPDMMLSLVREAQGQGRHFAALAYVDAYIQQFGVTDEVRPLQAHALRMTGQTEAAASVYRSLLNGPAAAQGLQGLGLMAGAAGDFGTASDYLARASRLRPIDADLLSDLGYARLQNGDLAGARVPLGQAAELNPASNKVVANLALLLLVDGATARAEQVMSRGQFSDEAKGQMAQLAADLQARLAAQNRMGVRADHASSSSLAAAPAVRVAAAPEPASVAVTPVVREVPPVASTTRQRAPSDSSSTRAVPTAMYPPLMELLGNTPLVR